MSRLHRLRKLLTLTAAAAFAWLPACYTTYGTSGTPLSFSSDSERMLRVGTTSRQDVLRLFGSPTDIQGTRDGEAFRYLFTKRINDGVDVGLSALWGALSLSFFRSEAKREDTENLTMFFDQSGKLSAWSYTPGFRAGE